MGTTNPLTKFHVHGGDLVVTDSTYPGLYAMNINKTDGVYGKTWGWMNYSNGFYLNGYAGTNASIAPGGPITGIFVADTTGNVAIGSDAPGSYKLYIAGSGYLGAAAWVYASDRRLKENITPLSYGIQEIMQLQPEKFDYINGDKENLGFIAQDIQKVIPEIVTTGSGGMLGVKTDMIVPVLVNAVKDLKKENDALKALVCLDHPTAEICK